MNLESIRVWIPLPLDLISIIIDYAISSHAYLFQSYPLDVTLIKGISQFIPIASSVKVLENFNELTDGLVYTGRKANVFNFHFYGIVHASNTGLIRWFICKNGEKGLSLHASFPHEYSMFTESIHLKHGDTVQVGVMSNECTDIRLDNFTIVLCPIV